MILKAYGLIWFLALAAGIAFYFTGSLTVITLPIIGFFYSTLALMGVVAVLPAVVDRHFTPKTISSGANG